MDQERHIDAGTPLGEAIATILQVEGVPFLSCYPTTPLIEAAARRELRPVLCRQERVGVGIADGYARVTRGRPPGVFAMQYGPGIENAHSGIATAFADSVPVMCLPLGYPSGREDQPRYYSAERLRPIAKTIERIRSPQLVGEVMRRAFSNMRTGRPGPVVVEVPSDLAGQPIGNDVLYQSPGACRSAGDPDAIEQAARMLCDARRPFILAGQGVLYAGASAELVELAELLDAPTASTLEGKSAFPEDHPLALGSGAATMSVPLRDEYVDCDVVLGVGVSFAAHNMALPPPRTKRVIHVTVDPTDIDKDCWAECGIVGDAQLVLRQLLDVLRDRLGGAAVERGAAARLAEARARWLHEWEPQLTSDEVPINPYRVVGALRSVLDPATSIVTHDSGSPRDQLTPFYAATVPHGYVGWGKSHALGTGLGLMMGAKLARPEKTCVHLMGDAAFGMVGLDFETAVRNEIPIVCVVNNNGTMAVETSVMTTAQERYRSRDIGGNYADLARAMGGWACRVEQPQDLEPALGAAIRANVEGQAALVEVMTSPIMTAFCPRQFEIDV